MPAIDYDNARSVLEEHFARAEGSALQGEGARVATEIVQAYDVLFASRTQAYREVLLGCILARLQDKDINIRLPYVNQGPDAYNGRTLDEKVVNPFLRSKKVPSSKGPFLSVFRRSVRFDQATRDGVRDKDAFDKLLCVIEALEATRAQTELVHILEYHLRRFVELREESEIQVSKLRRISLEQCGALISGSLDTPSGGRFPMFLIVATFRTIATVFELDWTVEFQGINVADRASGAGGDVTIRKKGEVVLTAEVTERVVSRSRVVSTFDTKIAPNAIGDYLFFIKDRDQAKAAIKQANRYFSQGHEVNFLEITNWIVTMLSVLGAKGREIFMNEMTLFLENVDVPKTLKIAWNDMIARIASS